MSKWIKKDLFENFQKEKIEEKDSNNGTYIRSNLIWDTPEKGSIEQAKVYEGRFLTDKKGNFYKRYLYHFWQSGDTWIFVLCTKTHNYKDFCPFCSVTSKLYNGTKEDKKQGSLLKKKERNVANFYVIKDHRDADKSDENKVIGKVKLYEFPGKVEQKVKKEITDRENGYGSQIFDPGEEGRNFILNVLSTKMDEKGKIWPDYSTSEFSRKQKALGNEEEIDAIMKTCIDLEEYIKSLETDKDKVVEILKKEFLWDLVETECLNNGYKDVETGAGMKAKKEDKLVEKSKVEKKEDELVEESKVEKKEDEVKLSKNNNDVDDLSDDDLLKELDMM